MDPLSELTEILQQLEESLLKPEVRSSPERIAQLLDDEFIEFGKSGKVWTKADCIEPAGMGFPNLTLMDYKLQILGPDSVLATFKIEDNETGKSTLRSSVWIRRNESWQMLFHQGTPAAENR